ncbi:hypothetical protein [Halalkalicoccus jeotgali]|uniref:hypothetical protein n=1 Tax=Halalkalicoccus jeotgali TaxID=413810 RepID=UPI0012DFD053|nr:hypothetical protein [Halalkalicoccus jeotgali]
MGLAEARSRSSGTRGSGPRAWRYGPRAWGHGLWTRYDGVARGNGRIRERVPTH